MRQSELLADVAEWCSTLTGETYAVDYAPMYNVSERQVTRYRAISPGTMRKETLTRGTYPQTYQEVRIQIYQAFPENNFGEVVPVIQNELEDILISLMSRANPVRFTGSDGTEATVKAAECQPAFDSGVSLTDLGAHQPVCLGCVNVMFFVG